MHKLMIKYFLLSAFVLSACQPTKTPQAPKRSQNKPDQSKTTTSKPAKPPAPKLQAPPATVLMQTINRIDYKLAVKPYEHAPRQWFYTLELTITSPKSSPEYVLRSFWQKKHGSVIAYSKDHIHPLRFEEVWKTISTGKVISKSQSMDYRRKAPIELKPGTTRTFLHDSRLGWADKTWDINLKGQHVRDIDKEVENTIAPGHHVALNVCLVNLAEPKTLTYYEFCLAEAQFKLNAENQMHVELKALSENTLPAKPPTTEVRFAQRDVRISPFKEGWERSYHTWGAKYDNRGVFYAEARPWRKKPITILYHKGQIIVGDRLYKDVPKEANLDIKGDVLIADNNILKFKRISQDAIADAYPLPQKERDYQERLGYKVFFRDGVGYSRVNYSRRDKDGKWYHAFVHNGLEDKSEKNAQIVHVRDGGQLYYKQKGADDFVAFGPVKKGDKIYTSMHRVWVNGKPRNPKK